MVSIVKRQYVLGALPSAALWESSPTEEQAGTGIDYACFRGLCSGSTAGSAIGTGHRRACAATHTLRTGRRPPCGIRTGQALVRAGTRPAYARHAQHRADPGGPTSSCTCLLDAVYRVRDLSRSLPMMQNGSSKSGNEQAFRVAGKGDPTSLDVSTLPPFALSRPPRMKASTLSMSL